MWLALALIILAPAAFNTRAAGTARTRNTQAASSGQAASTRPTRTKAKKGTLKGVVNGLGAEALAGGALSGVRVYLMVDADHLPSQNTTTDFLGHFEFPGVSAGSYTLRLALPGWQDKFLDGVEVQAGGTANITVELTPDVPSTRNPAPEPQLWNRSEWWGSSFNDVNIDELPTSRTVWSLLENQATTTVTQTLDAAQLETGTPSLFGDHGDSWTENQYLYNGFNTTDPYVTGKALVDPDYAALTSVLDVMAAKPPDYGGAGGDLVLAVPEPSSNLHGQAGLFFSDRGLQGDNMTPALVRLGFPGPERMNSLYDGNGQLGGALPFSQVSWPFFAAFSTQQLSKDLGGFADPIDAHADHILVELTPYQHGGRRLNLLYSGQQEFNDHDGAAIVVAPDATTRRNDNFQQFQGRWTDALSPTTVWGAGFGVTHAILSSGLDNSIGDGLLSTSTLDLPYGNLTGSAPLAQAGQRTRYEANAMIQTILKGFHGSHALAFGGDFDASTMSNRWFALPSPYGMPLQQILVNGVGTQVIEWNTPTEDRAQIQNFSLFLQDGWRPARWLEIPLGVRLDESFGKADGANNRISWGMLEPHAGVVFPVPYIRKLTKVGVFARGTYARYGHELQGQYFDYGNPDALSGKMYAWDDSNHDGIAQPSEIGQLERVFGGPYSGIQPGFRRPYTDEYTLGIESNVNQYLQVRIRGWRRYDYHLAESTDTGVPLSDYTPTVVNDPAIYSFSTETMYRMLTLYNEMPSALGHDFDTLGNPPGFRANAEGMDANITVRPGKRWEVSANYTAMATIARPGSPSNSIYANDTGVLNPLGNDPNSLVNNFGVTYLDRGKYGNVSGFYDLPWGLHTGVVVRYLDGLPYSPQLLVTSFNQGPFFVQAVPRANSPGFRTNYIAEADLRVSKRIVLPRGALAVDVDVFNLMNQSNHTQDNDLAIFPIIVDRVPLSIQAPRTARLGVQWSF